MGVGGKGWRLWWCRVVACCTIEVRTCTPPCSSTGKVMSMCEVCEVKVCLS